MKRKAALVFSAAALVGCLWSFIGIERMVGDHEVGVSWGLFIKHRPTVRSFYSNPAQHGLDFVPFADLSPVEQKRFVEFCSVRFGVEDPSSCGAMVAARGF